MHTHRVLLIVHGDGMERHRQQQTDLLAFFHLFFFSTFYLRSFSPHVRNDPFSGKCTLKSQWGKEGPSRAGCCLPSPRDAARKRCAPTAGLRLCQGTKGTEGDRGRRALRGSDTNQQVTSRTQEIPKATKCTGEVPHQDTITGCQVPQVSAEGEAQLRAEKPAQE